MDQRSLTLDMSKYSRAIQELTDTELVKIFEIGVAVKQSFTLTVSENSEFVKNELDKQMQPILKKIDAIQTQVKNDVAQIQTDVSKQATTQMTNFTEEATSLKKGVVQIQNNVDTQMSKFTNEVTSLKTGVENGLHTMKNDLVGEVQGVCRKVEPIRELEDRVTNTILSREEQSTQMILQKIAEYKDELRKLTQQMEKPAKKGSLGENTVMSLLQKNLPNYSFTDVSSQRNQGDIHASSPDDHHFLIEVKNWATNISKQEIDKFKANITSLHKVKVGLMFSLKSGISKKAIGGKFHIEVDKEKFLIYVPNVLEQEEIMIWSVLLANALAGMNVPLKDDQTESILKLCQKFQDNVKDAKKCREKMTIMKKAMEDLEANMESILEVIESARKEIENTLKKA